MLKIVLWLLKCILIYAGMFLIFALIFLVWAIVHTHFTTYRILKLSGTAKEFFKDKKICFAESHEQALAEYLHVEESEIVFNDKESITYMWKEYPVEVKVYYKNGIKYSVHLIKVVFGITEEQYY